MAAPGTFYQDPDGLLVGTMPDGTPLSGMTPDMRPELEASGMTFAQGAGGATGPGDGGGGPQTTGDFVANLQAAGAAPASNPGARSSDDAIRGTYPGVTIEPATPEQVEQLAASGGVAVEPSRLKTREQLVNEGTAAPARAMPANQDLGVPAPAESAPARSTPAKWVDQPLSELRTTQQQTEHSLYGEPITPVSELTGEEIDAHAGLRTAQDSIDAGDRREKERDILAREQLLNREGQLIAKERLADLENQKRAEMHREMRKTDAMRQVYEERVRDAAVDPKRYFRDMGVFTKIMAIVGSALQGYQMGMNGQAGMPPMITMLQELNKQDIEDQKLEYENAVAQHGRLDNQYQKALEVWGDPELAELQLEKDKLAIADEWIALNESAAANDMQRFAWQEERGKLQVAQEAINEELQTRKRDKIVSQQQATPKKLVGGSGGGGMAGTRAGKPNPEKIAAAQQKLDRARAAKAYAQRYAEEHGPDAKLPGYGLGSWVKAGLSVVQGSGTAEQEEARGHVSAIAQNYRKPGDSTAEDQKRLEKDAVGNGEAGNLYRTASQAELEALRELEAGYGVIPTQ